MAARLLQLTLATMLLLAFSGPCFSLINSKKGEELCPEEELCQSLTKQCAILRSPRGRPAILQEAKSWAYGAAVVNANIDQLKMLELDEKEQRMSIQARVQLLWYLPPCAWWNETVLSPAAMALKICYFPKDSIWHPNIILQNAYEDPYAIAKTSGDISVRNCTSCDYQKYVKYDLEPLPYATMTSYGKYDTLCTFDLKKFPFDRQQCLWEFATIEGSEELNFISFAILLNQRDDDFIAPSNIWELQDFRRDDQNGSNLYRARFFVKRQSQYYVLSIFLPLIVLMALQFVSLILPPEEPDRPTFAVTVMLAFSVMQPTVTAEIPHTSDPVYIFWYVQALLFLAALITVYTVVSCTWSRINGQEVELPCFNHRKLALVRLIDIVVAVISLFLCVLINAIYFSVVTY